MKHGDKVKVDILNAGMALWRESPSDLSARRIAASLRMTHAGVLYHFGTWARLKAAIADHAVSTGDSRVIAMLIAERHPSVDALSPDVRASYLASL